MSGRVLRATNPLFCPMARSRPSLCYAGPEGGEVTRATGSMVFVRGLIRVGEKEVLAVDGIWRVFRGM